MSTFNSPTDVVIKTLARSAQINNLDAAIATAFALLPDETRLAEGRVTYGVDTGAADAYLVELPKVPGSYTDGLQVIMRPTNTNTGASTIDVNSLGVKSIRSNSSNVLTAGDIVEGIPIVLIHSSNTGFFHLAVSGEAAAALAVASAAAAVASAAAASSSETNSNTSAIAAAASAVAAAASAASIDIGLNTVNTWTAQQQSYEAALDIVSGETDWDLDYAQNALLVLDENTTVQDPSNIKVGGQYTLRVKQTGSYTLDFDTAFEWGEISAPEEPAANGDEIIISFYGTETQMRGGQFSRVEA